MQNSKQTNLESLKRAQAAKMTKDQYKDLVNELIMHKNGNENRSSSKKEHMKQLIEKIRQYMKQNVNQTYNYENSDVQPIEEFGQERQKDSSRDSQSICDSKQRIWINAGRTSDKYHEKYGNEDGDSENDFQITDQEVLSSNSQKDSKSSNFKVSSENQDRHSSKQSCAIPMTPTFKPDSNKRAAQLSQSSDHPSIHNSQEGEVVQDSNDSHPTDSDQVMVLNMCNQLSNHEYNRVVNRLSSLNPSPPHREDHSQTTKSMPAAAEQLEETTNSTPVVAEQLEEEDQICSLSQPTLSSHQHMAQNYQQPKQRGRPLTGKRTRQQGMFDYYHQDLEQKHRNANWKDMQQEHRNAIHCDEDDGTASEIESEDQGNDEHQGGRNTSLYQESSKKNNDSNSNERQEPKRIVTRSQRQAQKQPMKEMEKIDLILQTCSPKKTQRSNGGKSQPSSQKSQSQKIISEALNTGKWSIEEHYRFLDGLDEYGTDIEQLQKFIKTRGYKQIESYIYSNCEYLSDLLGNQPSHKSYRIFNERYENIDTDHYYKLIIQNSYTYQESQRKLPRVLDVDNHIDLYIENDEPSDLELIDPKVKKRQKLFHIDSSNDTQDIQKKDEGIIKTETSQINKLILKEKDRVMKALTTNSDHLNQKDQNIVLRETIQIGHQFDTLNEDCKSIYKKFQYLVANFNLNSEN